MDKFHFGNYKSALLLYEAVSALEEPEQRRVRRRICQALDTHATGINQLIEYLPSLQSRNFAIRNRLMRIWTNDRIAKLRQDCAPDLLVDHKWLVDYACAVMHVRYKIALRGWRDSPDELLEKADCVAP